MPARVVNPTPRGERLAALGAPAELKREQLELRIPAPGNSRHGVSDKCFDAHVAADPKRRGTLVFRWSVGTEGRVTAVELLTRKFAGSVAGTCIEGVIRGAQFPAHEIAGSEPIVMPFKF